MEKVLCFMPMVLQIFLVVKGASNIQRKIKQRLVDWVDKKYQMLGSTVLCAEAQMNRKRENIIIKEREKMFSSLICRDKIRAAIRYTSEREKDGILIPGDVDVKTGDLVSEILESKHPIVREILKSVAFLFLSLVKNTLILK